MSTDNPEVIDPEEEILTDGKPINLDIFGINRSGHQYPPGYIDELFTMWYSQGKPTSRVFYPSVPDCKVLGRKPAHGVIETWIRIDFRRRAVALDEQVMNQVNQRMVADKVEMLQRHAKVGTHIQDMALKYLDEHVESLNVSNSVRLLVEGVRIERESRGISTTIEKIANLTDEELNRQVESILSHSAVEFLPSGDVDAASEYEQEVEP